MTPIRIFISSVQREFSRERERLRDYLRGDPLMRRFFEVFLFEDVPASDRRPDEVYLGEVDRCDIYVGLFGNEYGFEDAHGVSPTEREFDRATELAKHRLIFVMGADDGKRHPRMLDLIARAQAGLVRRRFATAAELVAGLYAALVQYLEAKELLRFGPFDAAQCSGATLDDLDVEGMYRFIRIARRARQFPLPEETEPPDLLRHLNLLNRGTADQSVPRNPLLAESMYLMRYIEKMGTGTLDMIRRCAKAGLPEPEFEVGAGFVATIWRAGGTTRGRPDTTQEESGTTPITTAIADSTTAKNYRKDYRKTHPRLAATRSRDQPSRSRQPRWPDGGRSQIPHQEAEVCRCHPPGRFVTGRSLGGSEVT